MVKCTVLKRTVTAEWLGWGSWMSCVGHGWSPVGERRLFAEHVEHFLKLWESSTHLWSWIWYTMNNKANHKFQFSSLTWTFNHCQRQSRWSSESWLGPFTRLPNMTHNSLSIYSSVESYHIQIHPQTSCDFYSLLTTQTPLQAARRSINYSKQLICWEEKGLIEPNLSVSRLSSFTRDSFTDRGTTRQKHFSACTEIPSQTEEPLAHRDSVPQKVLWFRFVPPVVIGQHWLKWLKVVKWLVLLPVGDVETSGSLKWFKFLIMTSSQTKYAGL